MPRRSLAALVACTLLLAASTEVAVAERAVPLIEGGQVAKRGEFPSLAFIAYRIPNGKDEAILCTGTVIAPRFVLTGAHCVHTPHVRFDVANFLVITSAVDWRGPKRQVSEVESVATDPRYNSYSGQRDAALLELSAPVSAPPLPLAKDSFWKTGSSAEVVGWGSLHRVQHGPTYLLHHATTAVLGRPECHQVGGASGQLCTLDPPPRKSTPCFGDSGGPLLMRRPGDGRQVEIGIVHGGVGYCNPRREALYTSTASVYSWVQRRLAKAH
jgi:secreted trypsin-like serine protease